MFALGLEAVFVGGVLNLDVLAVGRGVGESSMSLGAVSSGVTFFLGVDAVSGLVDVVIRAVAVVVVLQTKDGDLVGGRVLSRVLTGVLPLARRGILSLVGAGVLSLMFLLSLLFLMTLSLEGCRSGILSASATSLIWWKILVKTGAGGHTEKSECQNYL